ncbi:MAG: hypothetical protein C0395_03530 [Gemmatimonas sp.]|nr:hypothetical protein [Gemmatimonas sp.]
MTARLPLFALLAAIVLALGCTQVPEAPDYDNPLDPDGTGGDPFGVTAFYVFGGVMVNWTALDQTGVVGYDILRAGGLEGPYDVVGSVTHPTALYLDRDFAPNLPNYYKVRATDASGNGTNISVVTAARIAAPPRLTIADTTVSATRHLELSLEVAMGDSAAVDSLGSFATAVTAVFDEAGAAVLPWDLGAAPASGVWKHFYVRVYTAGIAGTVFHDSIKVRFAPDLKLEGNPATLAERTPALRIIGDGVTMMRFAPDRASLAAAAWLPGGHTHGDHQLGEQLDAQMVFGEFACDFGFTVIDSVAAIPDDLQPLTLVVNGGAPATSALLVPLSADAMATHMRFAETLPELGAASWQPYASQTTFAHSACAGDLAKTVWAQYRNDWTTADPVSGTFRWLPPEALGVTIAAPDTVTGGEVTAIAGTAVAGTCGAPLDLVEVDAGAGWQAASGLATWTYPWTAPAVDDTMTVTVSARVSAGADTATDVHDVVVLPD